MMSSKGKPTPKKGVGKFKECGKSSTKHRAVDVSEVTSKEAVLTYPFIKTADNTRLLPRYSAVLRRNEEEGVGMDDLDALQLELESLLSAVAVRARVFQEEIQALSNAEERQEKRGKISPLVPGKRVRFQEKIVKKFKETPGKVAGEPYQSTVSNKFMKTKGLTTATPNSYLPEHEMTDPLKSEAPKVLPPKNDTPNKFWTFVDPYCADITSDDVKLLEALIEENSDNAQYYEVPALGHHYSLRWAEEDTIDDRAVKNELPNTGRNSEKSNENVTTGPLTQRLLSALMEENFVPVDIICKGDENSRTSQLLKNFSVNNASSFERRVRKELEEQGILDMNDMGRNEESDEILQDLRRCQTELEYISAHNVQHLKRLLKQVNTELVRQDLKRRLEQADNEVIEVHREVLAARQKEKIMSKKETDRYWKTLKDRDMLLKQIDSLQGI